jgi:alkylation response protein AidB-like acyl-CoA dehydrogenase
VQESESIPGLAAHRDHVREVIARSAPGWEMREGHRAPTSATEEEELRRWYADMFAEGLAGANWPEAWGGSPRHHALHEVVTTEELIRARAPRPLDQVLLASHLILEFGTGEQKSRCLPRIRTATDIWCQLFSEPDAGSDLAGIKTRARQLHDGRFVVDGQKAWTTDGHWAQMGLLLARTGDDASRHRGISAFLMPMDTEGIEVRPLVTIGGAAEFNETFFDGVVLDRNALLGAVDGGWQVAMSGLEVERFGVGGNVALLPQLLDDLVAAARHTRSDGIPVIEHDDVRLTIADLAAQAEAAAAFTADCIELILEGRGRSGDTAIAKILHSETYHEIAQYGAHLLGSGQLDGSAVGSLCARRLRDAWLWSRALTISGGTSEIMRNILAKRRLELPQASPRG